MTKKLKIDEILEKLVFSDQQTTILIKLNGILTRRMGLHFKKLKSFIKTLRWHHRVPLLKTIDMDFHSSTFTYFTQTFILRYSVHTRLTQKIHPHPLFPFIYFKILVRWTAVTKTIREWDCLVDDDKKGTNANFVLTRQEKTHTERDKKN